MAQDFQTFIKNMLEGHGLNAPVARAPVARDVIQDVNAYNQNIPPPPPVAPVPTYAPPVVQQSPQIVPMDPRTFALFQAQQQAQQAQQTQQGPIQGPMPVTPTTPTTEPPATQVDPYSGIWQTVEYHAQDGTTYFIVMPEVNSRTLPEGASLVENGMIANEPDRVRTAEDEGKNGKRGDTQIGVLAQMPENVQLLFSTDFASTQGQSIIPTGTGENLVPPGTTQPTTQVPQVNAQGQGPDQVQQQVRDFDQMMRDMATTPPDQFMAEQRNNNQESLTITQLGKTNPEGAALLLANGITSIRADQMAVQYEGGQVSLVPASETPPPGATIITYGGNTAPPDPSAGNLSLGPIPLPDNALGELLGLGAYAPLGIADSIFTPIQRWWQDLMTAPTDKTWVPGEVNDAGEFVQNGTPGTILVQNAAGEMREIPMEESVPEGFRVVPREGRWESKTQQGPVGSFLENVVSGIDTATDWIPGVQQAQDVAQRAGGWWAEEMLPGGFGGYAAWQAQHPDIVASARESGYNGFTGEEAVWERYQADRNVIQRIVDTVSSDPSNLIFGESTAASTARRGVGFIDEALEQAGRVVDDVPVSAVERGVDNLPAVGTDVGNVVDQAARNRAVDAVEQVVQQFGDVVAIPDEILNEAVSMIARGFSVLGRGLGDIPVPFGNGRQLSDMFREVDNSVVREETENVRTQLDDVRGQRAVDRTTPPSVTQAVTPPRTPQFEEITLPNGQTVSVDINAPDADTSFSRAAEATRPQEPLAVDRPVEDLGRPADEVVESPTSPLAVDRPLTATPATTITESVDEIQKSIDSINEQIDVLGEQQRALYGTDEGNAIGEQISALYRRRTAQFDRLNAARGGPTLAEPTASVGRPAGDLGEGPSISSEAGITPETIAPESRNRYGETINYHASAADDGSVEHTWVVGELPYRGEGNREVVLRADGRYDVYYQYPSGDPRVAKRTTFNTFQEAIDSDIPPDAFNADFDNHPPPQSANATSRGGPQVTTATTTPTTPTPPETPPLARDAEFRASKVGVATESILSKWDERLSFLRPQTSFARTVGEDRVGRGFGSRPIDVARTIAPQEPSKWRSFINAYDRRLRRKGSGYIDLELQRQDEFKQLPHFQSDRFPAQREPGIQLRSAYEVLLEADNIAREEARLFNEHFGRDAILPEHDWKQWRQGGSVHTSPDALVDGRYQKGTPLAEATELAIFHPEESVRLDALNDIVDRLSFRENVGDAVGRVKKLNGNNVLNPKLYGKGMPPLFKDILSSAQSARLSIRNIRDAYWNQVELNRGMANIVDGVDQRLSTDDAARLSEQTTELTDEQMRGVRLPETGEEGQDVYEANFRGEGPPPIEPGTYANTGELRTGQPGEAEFEATLRGEGPPPIEPGTYASDAVAIESPLDRIPGARDVIERDVADGNNAGYVSTEILLPGRPRGEFGVKSHEFGGDLVVGTVFKSQADATAAARQMNEELRRRLSGGVVQPPSVAGELVSAAPPIVPGSNANPVKRLIGRSMDVDQAAIPSNATTPVTGVREEPNLYQHPDVPALIQRQNAGTSPMGRPVEVDQTAISADLPPGQSDAVAQRQSYEDALHSLVVKRGTPPVVETAVEAGPIGEGPVGRAVSRVENRLEDRAARRYSKREEYLRTKSETRVREMQNRSKPITREELDSFYVRGRAPGATQARVLGQRFSRGDSILERWDQYTDEYLQGAKANPQQPALFGGEQAPAANLGDDAVALAEEQAAKRVVGDYTVEILSDAQRVRYDAEYRSLLGKEYEDELTGKMVKRGPLDAQITALQRTLHRGADNKVLRVVDQIMSALRQTFLYNWLTGPRNIVTQLVGNSASAGLTGHFDTMGDIVNPNSLRRSWKTASANGELPESVMDQYRGEWGLGGTRERTKGSLITRDQTLDDVANTKPGSSLLGKWTRPIADRRVRQMSAAYDQLSRESLWSQTMNTNMLVPRKGLRDRMMASIPAGADAAEVQQVFDALPLRFSSSDLREALAPFDVKWADRNARDWQEALSKTDIAVSKEVDRVYFSGTETNADMFFKRALMFHYWTSRALPLYTEAIARNPVYLYNFMKLQEAMRDDSDLSGTKFFKFMQTPWGYNLLGRPDAFFATFVSIMDDAGYEPDGESTLGKILRKSPVMVNPLIMFGLNIAGAMGQTFAPDPIGANKWIGLADAAIDSMNAQFGWGLPPAGNPQEKALRHARDFVSGFLDPILPDAVADYVPYMDEMAYKENEVRSIVAEIALERGMSLDDPIVQAAMVDPESEMYQEAMKRYAFQDAADIALRIIPVTAVLYPKSQYAPPKERTLAITAEKESSQQAGMTQTTPRGQQLMDERDTIAAASEYSRTIQQQQDEYRQLGSPEARGAWSFYNNIKYGSLEQPITVSGQEYAAGDVAAMEDAQRETLANTWASEAGVADLIEEVQTQRKAYRDEHPEYGEYATWQAQINDYEGGAQKWATDTAAGNPNFARWLSEQPEDRRADEQTLTSLQAYMAYRADQMAYWENDPIANRSDVDPNPYNPMDTGASEGTSSSSTTTSPASTGPTEQGIVDQITRYNEDMAAYNAAASQMLGQEVNVDWLNPQVQQAVESNLSTLGYSKPYPGGYLGDYLQWANGQRGDTSIPAYLAWYAQRNPQAVALPTQVPVSP